MVAFNGLKGLFRPKRFDDFRNYHFRNCHQGTCSEGFAVLITTLPFPAATLIANPGQEKCIFLTVKMTTSKQILNPVLCFQQCFIFPLLFS